jgi:hypothetical protein
MKTNAVENMKKISNVISIFLLLLVIRLFMHRLHKCVSNSKL